jgi:hypothetical protein
MQPTDQPDTTDPTLSARERGRLERIAAVHRELGRPGDVADAIDRMAAAIDDLRAAVGLA